MADSSDWKFEKLSRTHDRTSFSSGVPPLDEFFKNSARQNAEAGMSATFVAVREGSNAISGFFTLRMGQVSFDLLPESERKKIPRYPVPVVHLARLAVDVRERGKGLGEELVMDAFSRAIRAQSDVAARAIEVVAKDAKAISFYAQYGFVSLLDDEHHMYLSMKAVIAAFTRG